MKSKKISLLLKLVVLVLVVYGTFTLVSMRKQISQKDQEAASLTAAISQTESETARMQEKMDALGTDEGIKAIARDELGFVSNGEMVFKEAGN